MVKMLMWNLLGDKIQDVEEDVMLESFHGIWSNLA